jgi:arylsulfatase A-like enzyme
MPPQNPSEASGRPLWTALSSALAAAALNVGVSCLDQPRAFAHPGSALLALLAALLVLLAVALVLVPAGRLVASWLRLDRDGLGWALGLALVTGAALAPLVEVGLRGATGTRAGVVVLLAVGLVLMSGIVTYLGRQTTIVTRLAPGTRGPLVACAVGLAFWLRGYRPEGVALLVTGVSAALFLIAAWRGGASRRVPMTLALLAAIVLAGGAGALRAGDRWHEAPASADPDRPSVVLLTIDTLRADRVLGTGPERAPTPALDALVGDSVVFEQARSGAPWTKPSLATLLTGVSPLVHGMTSRRARLPDEIQTLAERLRAEGYHTAGIGLNAHLERAFHMDQGFTDYAFPARPDFGISIGSRVLEALDARRFPELFPSTASIADTALGWLDQQHGEPFFLWVHFLDPHWPYEPPAEWLDEPLRRPTRWGEPDMVTAVQAGNTKPGEEERERIRQLYEGEIRYVDAELARLLVALKARGQYDTALIVLASDHGEEFWEHGRYEHGHTLYEEVLRVPLAVKLPGSMQRVHVAAPVSTTAVAPTVLDVLGIGYEPQDFSARSLRSWWQDPAAAVIEPSFATGTYYHGEKRGVVFDGLKLVLELDTGRRELYDLVNDPRELSSLSSSRPQDVEHGLELIQDEQRRAEALREHLGVPRDVRAEDDASIEKALQAIGYGGGENL